MTDDSLHDRQPIERSLKRRRFRAWTGTIWTDVDLEIVKSFKWEAKYLLISDDDHTQDGQLHWHCLVTYRNPREMPRLTHTTHWEPVKNRSQIYHYCKEKGPNFIEEGELTVNCANEEDWRSFVEMCKTHSPAEIIDSEFSRTYANYRDFAKEVYNTFKELPILQGDLQNEWYYGPPGTGKTKKAWDENPKLYIKGLNKWWDGYRNEDVVLLDDWDPKHEVLVSHLKQWTDRYPFRGECKGSTLLARPKKIIVTSNYSIEECFPNEQDINALKRRFKVTHFDKLP